MEGARTSVGAGPVLWPRLGAAAGLLAVALGVAGGSMEMLLSGPWPAPGDPSYGPFLALNRAPALTQSMLFLLGQGALIWFLGYVRVRLRTAEGAAGALSAVAFGTGLVAAAFNAAAAGVQIVLTMPSTTSLDPGVLGALMNLCVVLFAVANLPLAVFFTAVATLSLARRAFPGWLGGIAVAAALAALLSTFSPVPTEGPLSPLGGLTTALRLAPLLWYLPAAVLMLRDRP